MFTRYIGDIDLLSKVNLLSQGLRLIVQFLVIVHPDFSCSPGVPREHSSRASRESVRMPFAEYVADSRARDDF